MPQTARSYLLDRFRTDAVALRQRADALAARGAAPVPGPDGTMSRRMADACERVVAMLDAVPEADITAHAMATLVALVPLLEQHAAQEAHAPAVRAVYIGAATRIREVQAAESRAVDSRAAEGTARSPNGTDVETNVDDGTDDEFDLIDDDDVDARADDDAHHDADDDVDDDDLHDDDLHEHLPDDVSPTPTRGPRP